MQTQDLVKLAGTLLLLFATATAADDQFKDVEINTTQVSDGVYMLTGKGGNIGVSIGNDGVFLIDDQFAPLTGKIKASIAKLSDQPVRFLLNTHWHPDHTGGNENIGKGGTVIVAHDNVRKRLSVDNVVEMFGIEAPAMNKAGLPVITFEQSLTFHLNGDEILVSHVDNAHTDGDSIVKFTAANVIHTGDIYFAGMYPFIDYDTGGSVEGVIQALEQVLAMSDADTIIIPGHGPLSNRKELAPYVNMLKAISSRIQKMIAEQATLEQIQAAAPSKEFDGEYGNGYIKNTTFIGMLYKGMTQH